MTNRFDKHLTISVTITMTKSLTSNYCMQLALNLKIKTEESSPGT